MKRTTTAIVAALLTFGLVLGAGQAATAKTSKSCPKQSICLWTKANYKGKKLVVSDKGTTNLPSAFNNRVSSVKSNYTGSSSGLAFLFEKRNANSNGDYRCFGNSFDRARDLSDPNTAFDNVGSSVLLPKKSEPICF